MGAMPCLQQKTVPSVCRVCLHSVPLVQDVQEGSRGQSAMKELLLGCGNRTEKDLSLAGSQEFTNVVRLDCNKDHNPDVLWDLSVLPLPFADEEFDEIHAYEVLEHLAYQGDAEYFFAEFNEYYRLLKHGGIFYASVPAIDSPWLWGDPGHKRVITKDTLIFLDQTFYWQIGKTSMSDYRYLYSGDLRLVFSETHGGKFFFALQKY